MDILEQAAQVLHEEAQAIEQLITTLDQSFVNAVNMILACKGRVVCTGMGNLVILDVRLLLHWPAQVRRHCLCTLGKVFMAI